MLVKCHGCEQKIDDTATMCPHCGRTSPHVSDRRLADAVNDAWTKSGRRVNKTNAGFFAMFLGWLGVHRFYVGKWKSGLFYLLMFFSGVGTVVTIPLSIFESFRFWFMSIEKFKGKYDLE